MFHASVLPLLATSRISGSIHDRQVGRKASLGFRDCQDLNLRTSFLSAIESKALRGPAFSQIAAEPSTQQVRGALVALNRHAFDRPERQGQ